MHCPHTMLGIDVLSKESLQKLASKEGYLETVEAGLDNSDLFDVDIDQSRHTIILDVDHTLLFVRYFGDEMAVNDVVQYNGQTALVKSMIYEIQVHEKIRDCPEEYKTASYRAQIQHEVPMKNSIFTYIVENDDSVDTNSSSTQDSDTQTVRHSRVLNAEAVGCEIECESDNTNVLISFEEDSDELFALKPDMLREGHAQVELLHDGFLVRFRPRLAEFLNKLNEHFNVILFTAAERDVYEGLLSRVHGKLINSIDQNNLHSEKLWSGVFYRDSCEVRRVGNNTYHVKNLCRFGIDMGRILIVDNNPGSFHGFEPNAICCGDYFGAMDGDDDVLLREVYPRIEKIVRSRTTDVRYILCDLPMDVWEEQSFGGCEEEMSECAVDMFMTDFGNHQAGALESTLQTSIQSRRHSFHAGSTKELSREIQLDRTIQFLQCLHFKLNEQDFTRTLTPRIGIAGASYDHTTTTSYSTGGCIPFGLTLHSHDIHVDSDSENESVKTTVILDDDVAMIEPEAGMMTQVDPTFRGESMMLLGKSNENLSDDTTDPIHIQYRATTKFWQ